MTKSWKIPAWNTTKELHPWVKRDYRPHSRFVIIHDKYVDEVIARLLLMGFKRRGHTSYSRAGDIMSKDGEGRVLFLDNNSEFVLSAAREHDILDTLGVY